LEAAHGGLAWLCNARTAFANGEQTVVRAGKFPPPESESVLSLPDQPTLAASDGEVALAPPKKPLRHKQWGGATFGLLLGLGGLIAGRLGQLYPLFDVFSQFSAQFMAMCFGFAVALFFSRFKKMVGMVLTIAILMLYGAWPHLVSKEISRGPFALQNGEKLLRVAHFNTYKNNADYLAISAEITRLDADVVTLVEMSPAKKRGVLQALKAVYPHQFDCAGGQYCDMAIISKHPMLNAIGLGEWVGAPFVLASLGGDLSGVTIVGVHTTRFPHSRAQLKQVTELVKMLQNVPGDFVIAGDFNSTPFSRVTRTVEQGAGVSRLTELPTWPTQFGVPQLAIDHIFASPSFRVLADQQIGNAAGSDHFPIVISLAWRTPQ
jgi:endonuclease/exonuclease/phosphatase (EEP) superfamily protein YafD